MFCRGMAKHQQGSSISEATKARRMHKIPAFIREAVALVVLVFFFSFLLVVIELQTQVSRFQRLLLYLG